MYIYMSKYGLILYSIVLYLILYYIVLYLILYSIVLYLILYYIVLYLILYSIVLYLILYYIVLYLILYSIVFDEDLLNCISETYQFINSIYYFDKFVIPARKSNNYHIVMQRICYSATSLII